MEVLAPHDKKKSTVDLSALVNVRKSTLHPVNIRNSSQMQDGIYEELAKNPNLATITSVDYQRYFYRGNVHLSRND